MTPCFRRISFLVWTVRYSILRSYDHAHCIDLPLRVGIGVVDWHLDGHVGHLHFGGVKDVDETAVLRNAGFKQAF